MKKLWSLIAFFVFLPLLGQETYVIPSDSVGRSLVLPDRCFQTALLPVGADHSIAYLTSKEVKGLFKTGYRITDVNADTEMAVRYSLRNETGADYKILLPDAASTQVFYVAENNGPWKKYTTGRLLKWKDRQGIKQLYRVPYTLPAGKTVTVYQYCTGIGSVSQLIPVIDSYDVLVNSFFFSGMVYHAFDLMLFMFLGFLAFVMVINLFFYYVARERVYLTYAFTILVLLLLNCSDFILDQFFEGYLPGIFKLQVVVTMISILLSITTIRQFLRVSDYYPLWDKFLLWLPVLFFLLLGVSSINKVNFGFNSSNSVVLVIGLFMFMFYIVAFIVLVIKMYSKNAAAKTFVIAIGPLVVVCLAGMFNILPGWLVMPAAVWTILLISWRMFVRFKNTELDNVRMAIEREEERNRIIAEQNARLESLVEERTSELAQSLSDLKQTQAQLIQSEKMASLGELTAGIAHEIQNPLNFVNNFSDVSIELLDEMQEELEKGDVEEVKAIAEDVKQNLGKIAHHGRRADSIVKGMLQHSRTSSGQKELTDVNALGDEYLRLAYHGLRAKDKSFNAELIMDLDGQMPKIPLLTQDFGRVLLNLFTNAFYATQQKAKQDSTFKPIVKLTTAYKDGAAEIRVYDNGTGIPDEIKDKILQPFFTTKPTGEGTGLGLSLSYDIVVKGHGGTINIESEEGVYTEFIITVK